MPKDNVTPLKTNTIKRQREPNSLEHVIALMQAWRRDKKNRTEKIPDEVWDQIFILLQTIPESKVLTALGMKANQLINKREERQFDAHGHQKNSEQTPQDQNETVEFCEAKSTFPLEYKPAQAFTTTTSVVELYRPDGMLMKIHICTDRFEELLRAFFKG
jgi:hypothetical protein